MTAPDGTIRVRLYRIPHTAYDIVSKSNCPVPNVHLFVVYGFTQ